MEIVFEVVTGDDLVIDTIKPGDNFRIVVGDELVKATSHAVRYVPEEDPRIESEDSYQVSISRALSWESQVVQYQDAPEPDEPGITYYAGDVGPDVPPVDCLLFWARRIPNGTALHIVGILNHYSVDYPPWEKEGNVNVWVRQPQQRQGIATALWDEAVRRWDVALDQQRFTESGVQLARALDRRNS